MITIIFTLIFTLLSKKIIGRKRPIFNAKLKNKPNSFRGRENNCSLPSGDAYESINYVINFYYLLVLSQK